MSSAAINKKSEVEFSLNIILTEFHDAEILTEYLNINMIDYKIKEGYASIPCLFCSDFKGSVGQFIDENLSKSAECFKFLSQYDALRKMSVGIFYDATKIAAFSCAIEKDVIRKIADLNFSIDISVFPSSMDEE